MNESEYCGRCGTWADLCECGRGGWDEPEPLESRAQLPDFPTHCLPPVVARYVDELCRSLQVPSGLAGPVALGVLSAASAGRVRVQVRPDWMEPVNLWIVPTADPASKKSAVVAAFRKPLDVAEGKLRDLLGPRVIESRTEKKIREQNAAKLEKVAADNPDPKNLVEAIDAARLAEEVRVPAMPRLTVGAATPEALVTLLAEQGGRIAAISAEAGIFDELTGGRYTSSANLDPLLNAHAGDMIQVDRKTRGPERVEDPALTLIASIQPYALRKMLTKEDFAGRGLLARVLWSLPPSNTGSRVWEVESVSGPTRDGYTNLVEGMAYDMATREEVATLRLSPEAYDRLGAFHDEVEQALSPGGDLGDGLVKLWAGKLVGAAARIAGVLHAAGGVSVLGIPVPGATMRDAVEVARYFRAHAVEALGLSEDTRTATARLLCEWLVKSGESTFTVRKIQQYGPRPLCKKKSEEISKILTHLAVLGYVRQGEKSWELRPDAGKYLNPSTASTASTASTPATVGDKSAGQVTVAAVDTSDYSRLQVSTPPTATTPVDAVDGGAYSSAYTATRGSAAPVDGVDAVDGVGGGVARSGMAGWNERVFARRDAANGSATVTVPEPRRPVALVEPNPFDFDGLNCPGCGYPVGSVGCSENCGVR